MVMEFSERKVASVFMFLSPVQKESPQLDSIFGGIRHRRFEVLAMPAEIVGT
jgi:hypothetical protein